MRKHMFAAKQGTKDNGEKFAHQRPRTCCSHYSFVLFFPFGGKGARANANIK
jgi:hypothetical protein